MTTRSLSIETSTHGRVEVHDPGNSARGLMLAFHGYGQSALEMLEAALEIPGAAAWRIGAVQGLHRFYARNERVVASWMTRQDREDAVADNVRYVDRVAETLVGPTPVPIVLVGFSQGASMAHRAAALGARTVAGVIALAGDVPPEARLAEASRPWPPVLIGVGDQETWYTPDKVSSDVEFLESRGTCVDVVRFSGGHEWTGEFRRLAGAWLERRLA